MLTHRKKTFKTRYFSFNHVKTLIEEAQLKHNVPFKIENCNAVSEGEWSAKVAQLIEHRATREVVSSTPAGPTFRVLK